MVQEQLKKNICLTDIWIFVVILLFTLFEDVVYVVAHYMMGIQISDYWLVCNVAFYAIELICLTAAHIAGSLNPDQKDTYEAIAHEIGKGVSETVISSISDNIQLPELTSGEKSEKERYKEDDEYEVVG